MHGTINLHYQSCFVAEEVSNESPYRVLAAKEPAI
jgi:hypothetical protein